MALDREGMRLAVEGLDPVGPFRSVRGRSSFRSVDEDRRRAFGEGMREPLTGDGRRGPWAEPRGLLTLRDAVDGVRLGPGRAGVFKDEIDETRARGAALDDGTGPAIMEELVVVVVGLPTARTLRYNHPLTAARRRSGRRGCTEERCAMIASPGNCELLVQVDWVTSWERRCSVAQSSRSSGKKAA